MRCGTIMQAYDHSAQQLSMTPRSGNGKCTTDRRGAPHRELARRQHDHGKRDEDGDEQQNAAG